MTMRYTIEPDRRLVRVVWEGNVPIQEWADMMDHVIADPRFQKGFRFLSDRRAVTRAPTADEIRTSVDYFANHQHELGHTHWAILTAPGAADFGMMRMGEIMAGEFVTLEYFADVDAAERWIDHGPIG
jgi:hypothetical protein